MSLTADDAAALARAVELARRGVGEVEPNPPVGAVLHVGGRVLAEGFHAEYGEAHAEAAALAQFAEPLRHVVPAEATLTVTLEPCSGRGPRKKQPRCVDAIVSAGVRRVVVGEVDPNPTHAGRGLDELRSRGVAVELAPAGSVASDLLAEFRAHLGRDRPYVLLKWAQSADGAWRSPEPGRRWISSEASRAEVHRLRAHVDAILVGSSTVLDDDPRLTARPRGARELVRVVVDERARVPPTAQLFRMGGEGPVWWVVGSGAGPAAAGVTRIELARPHDLERELLPELRRRGVERLLVEGGPTVAAAFARARLADRARVFVAPDEFGVASPAALALDREGRLVLDRSPVASRVESVAPSGRDRCYKLRLS